MNFGPFFPPAATSPPPALTLTIVRYDHGSHRMEYRCDSCSGITRCLDTLDDRYTCGQPACHVSDSRDAMMRRYRDANARAK